MAKTMFDYINSSTELIEENLKKRIALTETMVNEYIKGPYHNITIVASGSSNNAAQCARLYMEKVLKCKVTVISPFEFIHAEHSVASDEMVIAVSQSGYSVNTMEALKFINDKLNRKAIVLTGYLNSDSLFGKHIRVWPVQHPSVGHNFHASRLLYQVVCGKQFRRAFAF